MLIIFVLGAVKFGDKLSIQSAENLIRQLAQCSLPFQCAHGRPVLAPLVSFDSIHYEIAVYFITKYSHIFQIIMYKMCCKTRRLIHLLNIFMIT